MSRRGIAEQKSYETAKAEGWSVLTIGKPDKILFRFENNKIQIKFREDKGIGDRLSADQMIYLTLLKKLGLDAEVWYEWGESGFSKEWIVGPEEEMALQKRLEER